MAAEQVATTATAGAPLHLVRFACDSDELDALIPTNFVRTYSDLIADEAAFTRLQARFPDSVVELFDRGLGDPTGLATLMDVEPGALSAGQAAARIHAKTLAGVPWLATYSDENDLPEVLAACQSLGLDPWHIIASPGRLQVPSHPDAQSQFATAAMLGWHIDLTIVWNPAYRPVPGTGLLTPGTPDHDVAGVTAAAAAAQTPSPAGPAAAAALDLPAMVSKVLMAHGGLAMAAHHLGAVTDELTSHLGPEALELLGL